MYDVFISYRRDGGFEMARLLYEHLTALGLNVFFDLEELRAGQFNVKLYQCIDESENFVLVLPPNSLDRCVNEDDWLRLEIEHAILKRKNIVPLTLVGFAWPASLPKSMDGLHLFNAVNVSREYFDASISRLLEMLQGVTISGGTVTRKKQTQERYSNYYFYFDDNKEKRRLKLQQNILRSFDAQGYKNVFDRYENLRVLDVGSNTGDFIFDRMGGGRNIERFVGLEYDPATVEFANGKYGDGERIKFYAVNVEDEEFADRLEEICEDGDGRKFNVINVSMLLLHLKSPYRLLKNLRRALSDDGTIIIKDIDDGFNIAYPDENGEFARVVEICRRNETSGYRHTGRQVFTLLSRAGFKNVKLDNVLLSTVGMDFEERSALFDIYFSFIMDDLRIMTERYPLDGRIREDFNWYKKSYEDLEEKFQNPDFFFSLGFVLFTAGKR